MLMNEGSGNTWVDRSTMVFMVKLVLDTLPLVNGTSHDAACYIESITACLEKFDVQAPSRVYCCTTDGAKVNFVTARKMEVDI